MNRPLELTAVAAFEKRPRTRYSRASERTTHWGASCCVTNDYEKAPRADSWLAGPGIAGTGSSSDQ